MYVQKRTREGEALWGYQQLEASPVPGLTEQKKKNYAGLRRAVTEGEYHLAGPVDFSTGKKGH